MVVGEDAIKPLELSSQLGDYQVATRSTVAARSKIHLAATPRLGASNPKGVGAGDESSSRPPPAALRSRVGLLAVRSQQKMICRC